MSAGFVDGNTSFTKNIHGETGVTGSSNLDLIRDYYRLQILFNRIIFQLKPPMQLYSDGDFEDFIVSMPNILTFSTNINDDSVFYYDNENELL